MASRFVALGCFSGMLVIGLALGGLEGAETISDLSEQERAWARFVDGPFWEFKQTVRSDDLEAVRAGVEQLGTDSDERQAALDSCLLDAAKRVLPEIVDELLRLGANPTCKDEDGFTPLHMATGCSWCCDEADPVARHRIVDSLLAASANVDATGGPIGLAPLSCAARLGDPGLLDRLLTAGAWPEARDEYGETALHTAAGWGHADAVRLLLAAGADINARDNHHRTPMVEAVDHGDTTTVRILIEHGADLHVVDDSGRTAASHVWFAEPGVKSIGANMGIVRLLLEAGAPLDESAVLRIGSLNSEALSLLLDRGVALDNREGATLLITAARLAYVDLIYTLLAAGVDVNARVEESPTPLMAAAWRGDPETVDVLLAAGADVDSTFEGSTAADVAYATGAFEIADRLRDLKQDRPDPGDEIPIAERLASIGAELESEAQNYLEVVRAQFEECVELVNARSEHPQGAEADPLWAEMEARLDARFLAEHGYPRACSWDKDWIDRKRAELEFLRSQEWNDPRKIAANQRAAFEVISVGGTAILDGLLEHGLDIEAKDDHGRSLLDLAVHAGDLNTVVVVVAAGARVETVSRLLEAGAGSGTPGIVRVLLEAGASYQATMDELRHLERGHQLSMAWTSIPLSRAIINQAVVPECWTLLSAVSHRSPAHVRMIASALDDVNCTTERWRQTPLFVAIESHGEPSIVEALLAAGADPNTPGYNGWRPLHGAASLGQLGNIEGLLRAGADVHAITDSGTTALHLAAHQGDIEAMSLLLAAGAEIDSTTIEEATPLMEAVRGDSLQAVEYLLIEGAKPWLKDCDQKTAFDHAINSAQSSISDTLYQIMTVVDQLPGAGHQGR